MKFNESLLAQLAKEPSSSSAVESFSNEGLLQVVTCWDSKSKHDAPRQKWLRLCGNILMILEGKTREHPVENIFVVEEFTLLPHDQEANGFVLDFGEGEWLSLVAESPAEMRNWMSALQLAPAAQLISRTRELEAKLGIVKECASLQTSRQSVSRTASVDRLKKLRSKSPRNSPTRSTSLRDSSLRSSGRRGSPAERKGSTDIDNILTGNS